MPLIDFLFEKTVIKLDLTTARDKSNAVDRLLPVIAALNDPIRQAHYLQKLAALVKVDMNTIKASLSRLKPAPVRRKAAVKPTAAGTLRPLESSSREEYCLSLLLQNPELRNQQQDISLEYFKNSENREIFNIWQEAADILSLKERIDPAIHEHLDAIINKSLPGARNNIEGRFIDCVMELRKTYLRNLAARRAESGETSDDTSRLEEDVEISHQLRELEAQKNKKRNSSFGRTRR
jgi:DNA primase